MVPVDDESHFVLEIRLVLGYRDQTQNLLERSMETLHDGDAAVPPDRSESRQNTPGFAPDVLEVLALELGALIHDQVFGPYSLRDHDSIQGGGDFLGCGSALEHGASRGASGEMIDHV
jgi:hypothetical protein